MRYKAQFDVRVAIKMSYLSLEIRVKFLRGIGIKFLYCDRHFIGQKCIEDPSIRSFTNQRLLAKITGHPIQVGQ